MECGLCYNDYNQDSAVPKVLKSCPHTYCHNCLTQQKEKDGLVFCPICPSHDKSFTVDPCSLPTNSSLLKIIEFRKNEQIALNKMKKYEMENPQFFSKIDEVVTRDHKPFEIQLAEISQNELIYYEHIENPYLDKRSLGPQQFHYKKYVFNMDSIFMNYLFLNQKTKLLFLFRRLNGCQHKFSCWESILRKLYQVVSFYSVFRTSLYFILKKLYENSGDQELLLENKYFIFAEVFALLLIGGVRSAGCFIRFMSEEIITQS